MDLATPMKQAKTRQIATKRQTLMKEILQIPKAKDLITWAGLLYIIISRQDGQEAVLTAQQQQISQLDTRITVIETTQSHVDKQLDRIEVLLTDLKTSE